METQEKMHVVFISLSQRDASGIHHSFKPHQKSQRVSRYRGSMGFLNYGWINLQKRNTAPVQEARVMG